MKANELMIGDYIAVKPSGMPIKVAAVHHKKVAYHACINKLSWVRESLLEPIPLTTDVLEKNGWEKRPTGYVFYTDGKGYDNSLWYIFGSNTFVINTTEFQIKYVHELQHAMRLCGIEKEIEL